MDVVFALHGFPRAIHEILHGRTNAGRFHVRWYIEEGTNTTPFDMVVLNPTSRYHLCMEAVRRSPKMRFTSVAITGNPHLYDQPVERDIEHGHHPDHLQQIKESTAKVTRATGWVHIGAPKAD